MPVPDRSSVLCALCLAPSAVCEHPLRCRRTGQRGFLMWRGVGAAARAAQSHALRAAAGCAPCVPPPALGRGGGGLIVVRTYVVIFGYTEEQISHFFMTYGVGAFILFMLFIIGHLAWESKAGKFGTFVLFLGLAVGFIGFIAKAILQWYLEK